MATIYKRNDLQVERYRVIIRRKNVPPLSLTFVDYDNAKEWVIRHEYDYIRNPDKYHKWIQTHRLHMFRAREFDEDLMEGPR